MSDLWWLLVILMFAPAAYILIRPDSLDDKYGPLDSIAVVIVCYSAAIGVLVSQFVL